MFAIELFTEALSQNHKEIAIDIYSVMTAEMQQVADEIVKHWR